MPLWEWLPRLRLLPMLARHLDSWVGFLTDDYPGWENPQVPHPRCVLTVSN